MNIDLTNSSNLDSGITEKFSNFQLFGIGKPTAKQLERKEKRKEAKEERQGLGVFKRVINITQKVNLPAVILRAGVLASARLNVFGVSRRVYPAFLTDEEIKKRNFDIGNAKKAKDVWNNKFKKAWLLLGGRSLTLEDAIKKGYDKPIFNTKKSKEAKAHEKATSFNGQIYQLYEVKPSVEPMMNFDSEQLDLGINNFNGDDFSNVTGADDAAIITPALGIIAGMVKTLTNAGVSKNPYSKNSPEYKKIESDNANAEKGNYAEGTPATEEEMKAMYKNAEGDVAAGGDPNDYEKIMGIPKKWFWVGVSVIGLLGIYAIVKLKQKRAIIKA
jgi:hypothetical protein